jgi:hypothetical protein
MWYEHCTHCNQDQLFGFRRFVRVENERKGVIGIHWSCPACQGLNRFQTGMTQVGSTAALLVRVGRGAAVQRWVVVMTPLPSTASPS